MAEISSALFTSFLPKLPLLPFISNLHGFAASSCAAHRRTRCSISAEPMPSGTSSPTIPWGCEIESLESAFSLQRWLSESGLPPQKMDIRRVDVGERGLVALNSIRKGEKLLFVPPSLVITADSEWTHTEAGYVMRNNSVPDWPLLATYLISEASLGDSSRWSIYISALPRQPYSLLYWTRAELDMYLVASQIRVRAIERVSDVTGVYNDLRARIFSKHPTVFPEEVFNLETFKWSFGILFSRLVRLSAMDGKVALVPWADMLNHSSEVKTFLDYDKSSRGIVFSTDRVYQSGEQVFISYGKKSNGELLLSYGFVPKEGANPNDSVELSLSLKKNDQCYNEKMDALRKHGLSTSGCCFDTNFFVEHGVEVLEDLVITLADAVACIYLELISVDSDFSIEINSLGLKICPLSTRALQRLRNEVVLKQWLQQNFESVVSLYEDRFELFVLFRLKMDDELKSRAKRSIWQKLAFSKQAIPSTPNCVQIKSISLTVKRTKELQVLTGWRYYFSLFLEFSDVAMPLVKAVFDKARSAVSFFLMCMIGRSLGLVFSGIRQSLGWK